MEYTITDIDEEQRVVELDVTWDDKTTYHKRMMADLSSAEALKAQIEAWATQYDNDRKSALTVPKDVLALVGKKQG